MSDHTPKPDIKIVEMTPAEHAEWQTWLASKTKPKSYMDMTDQEKVDYRRRNRLPMPRYGERL